MTPQEIKNLSPNFLLMDLISHCKTYIASANHSRQTGAIFISLSGGLFTKLCRDFQKLADGSYVREKPNSSLAVQHVFLAVLMGNGDSTHEADVADIVYRGDRWVGSHFS
jgi:hypothetical protein